MTHNLVVQTRIRLRRLKEKELTNNENFNHQKINVPNIWKDDQVHFELSKSITLLERHYFTSYYLTSEKIERTLEGVRDI